MPLDIGGGQRGEGGTLADGSVDDALETPILEGRELKDYTPAIDPGLQPAIEALDLGDDSTSIRQYRVVTVNDDTITAQEFDGNTPGTTVLLARPFKQRRSVFDGNEAIVVYNGETLSGTYTYETPTRRVLELSNGRQIVEEVFPSYNANDIVYGSQTTNGTDIENVDLIEINNDGRKFRPVNQGLRQLVITGEQFDYWECQPIIDGTIDTSATTVNVAKPFNLRRTPFDVTTRPGAYAGIEYTYAFNGNKVERTAEDTVESITQLEILIPQVVFEESIIYAALTEQSDVEVDGNDLKLLDINADARYWARRG
jgi:hypothetical protein